MSIMDFALVEASTELTDDGDTFDLPDGRTLRLTIEADEFYNGFDEVDVYGKVEPRGPRYNRQRPDEFDGNAEILWPPQNCDPVWWQPPEGVKRTDPGFDDLRNLVRDLVAFGWTNVTVKVLAPADQADRLGHRPVLGIASLSGIDTLDGDYKREVVGELIDEALGDADGT